MKLFYGRGAYLRANGNLPRLRLRNMFVEQSPSDDDGIILLSREALSEHSATVGTGPVRCVFQQDGVFSGDVFRVVGSGSSPELYRGATLIGALTGVGSGAVSVAGTTGEILIAAVGTLYSYNGTNLQAVTFPDTASVRKVIFHDGLFIAARDGGHKYYWSAVLDGRTWDALDFASAESAPDALLDLYVIHDMLYLFGEETTEPWANTGDADAPYQRQELAILSKGIKSTGCLSELDEALWYVGNDDIVYSLRGGESQRVSDHGIEELIGDSATVSCFSFIHQGHSFFCVRLDDATYAYDVATQQWCEFASYGRDNFAASCSVKAGNGLIFGDDATGKLWTLSGFGEDPFERLFTVALPIEGGAVAIDCIRLWANVGWTEDLVGQGADPVVELRGSNTGGATFSTDWRPSTLGKQGEYRKHTEWRRLGTYDDPGALFEIRTTDPVPFRVSAVSVPEQRGGRSR